MTIYLCDEYPKGDDMFFKLKLAINYPIHREIQLDEVIEILHSNQFQSYLTHPGMAKFFSKLLGCPIKCNTNKKPIKAGDQVILIYYKGPWFPKWGYEPPKNGALKFFHCKLSI